jgi:hypothetical protein
MRKTRIIFAAILSCGGTQAAATVDDEQFWFQAVGQGRITGDLVYFAEVQSRFGHAMNGVDQFMLRPAIGMKLSDRLTIYQGYAHVRTPTGGGGETRENRAFQQVSWSLGQVAGGPASSRTRLEQRWLSSGKDTGWRLRQMLRLAMPLTQTARGVSALGYSEGFFALNDTDWGARRGMDRVRTFAGVEVPMAGKSTVELGYLNQYVNNRGRPDDVDHVLSISLQLRH